MSDTIPASVIVADYDLRVRESSTDMGQSLAEDNQFVSGPGGPWVATLTVRVTARGYADWLAFLDSRRGVNVPFLFYPRRHRQFVSPSDGLSWVSASGSAPVVRVTESGITRVTESGKTRVTEGGGASVPALGLAAGVPVIGAYTGATVSVAAGQYGTTLTIAHAGRGGEWVRGAMFNLHGATYRVAGVTAAGADTATLVVVPRLRAPASVGAPLMPAALRFRLASRDTGRIAAPANYADAGLDLVEFFG